MQVALLPSVVLLHDETSNDDSQVLPYYGMQVVLLPSLVLLHACKLATCEMINVIFALSLQPAEEAAA